MKYTLEISGVFEADAAAAWQVWTDMPRFPEWDPREEETRLDGAFEVGAGGWSKQRGNPGGPFTITAIEPGRMWQVSAGIPGGRLMIDHTIEELPDGRSRFGKRYEVRGPMAIAFRLWWGPQLRKHVPGTFSALAARSAQTASV